MSRVYYYEADNLKVAESLARYRFALSFLKDKEVLDVGCGARKGPFLLSDAARRVVALDISEDAIRHCVKTWPSLKVKYLTASALALPFCDESFDVVVSFEVLEHLLRQDDFLKEIRRVLRKNGVFVLSTPNREVMSPKGIFSNPDHVREFSVIDFKELLNLFFHHNAFYGQFSSNKVRSVEIARKEGYGIVSRAPVFLKKLLPRGFKEIFLRRYFNIFSKLRSGFDENNVRDEDFPIKKDDLGKARYLIAVCQK